MLIRSQLHLTAALAAVLIAHVPTACFGYADDQAEIESLLEQVLALQQRADHYSADFTDEAVYEWKDSTDRFRNELSIVRHNKLLDVAGDIWLGREGFPAQRIRAVVNEKVCVQYSFDPEKFDAAKGGVAWVKKRDAQLHRTIEVDGGPLDGYGDETNGQRLAEVLLEAEDPKSMKEGEINGITCAVVEGDSNVGLIMLWITKDVPHRVLRYRFAKDSDDPLFGKTIAELGKMGAKYGNMAIKSWTAMLDDIVYESVDDELFPIAGRLAVVNVMEDGTELQQTHQYNRTNVRVGIDAVKDHDFTTDLREGANITFTDDNVADSGNNYAWVDGFPKLISTDVARPPADLAELVEDPNEDNGSNKWVILGTITVALLAAVGFTVWKTNAG